MYHILNSMYPILTFLLTLLSYPVKSLDYTLHCYRDLLTSLLTSLSLYPSHLPTSPPPPASEHLIRLPYHILRSQSYASTITMKFCAAATVTSDQLRGNPFAVFPSTESCVVVPWSVILMGVVLVWWVLPMFVSFGDWVVKVLCRGVWWIAKGLVRGVGRRVARVAGFGRGGRGQLVKAVEAN